MAFLTTQSLRPVSDISFKTSLRLGELAFIVLTKIGSIGSTFIDGSPLANSGIKFWVKSFRHFVSSSEHFVITDAEKCNANLNYIITQETNLNKIKINFYFVKFDKEFVKILFS